MEPIETEDQIVLEPEQMTKEDIAQARKYIEEWNAGHRSSLAVAGQLPITLDNLELARKELDEMRALKDEHFKDLQNALKRNKELTAQLVETQLQAAENAALVVGLKATVTLLARSGS